jgi:hypothetical protein
MSTTKADSYEFLGSSSAEKVCHFLPRYHPCKVHLN